MAHHLIGQASIAATTGARRDDAARPVSAPQRIASLDVLRGFALLGILVLNIEVFSGPITFHNVPLDQPRPAFVGWHAELDYLILWVKWAFFEGRMRTLFAMLYGAGIILLTRSFEQRGDAARGRQIYFRRNLWLLAFGLAHGILIWTGDILTYYALLALVVMYPLRRVGARTLVTIGLIIGIGGGSVGLYRMTDAGAIFEAERVGQLEQQAHAAVKAHRPLTDEQRAALASEARRRAEAADAPASVVGESGRSYLQSIGPRAASFFEFIRGVFGSGWILEVVGSMMVGMGLFKLGFLTGDWSRRAYALTAGIGYALTVPLVTVGLVLSQQSGFAAPVLMRWLALPYGLEVLPGAIANAALLLLIWKSGVATRVTTALGKVGRTAFSNYIGTSLMCQFIFAWGPWPLFAKLEYHQQLYVIAGIWTINLVASALWLRWFAFGPLEWLWRSLVYGRRQPMRGA
ncbi:DUF418 domain-containing protein [Sphingomonas sp. HF-S3]|uniref:DUF418 domain-containing protein n=1 Tax=Sphingomonas rustica TaxID=3103142 RepID=A0ABV0BBD3_9SPHN